MTSPPVGAPLGKRRGFPLAGHTSVHLVHVNQTLGRSKWTKSFIDRLCGLWTNAARVHHEPHLTCQSPFDPGPTCL